MVLLTIDDAIAAYAFACCALPFSPHLSLSLSLLSTQQKEQGDFYTPGGVVTPTKRKGKIFLLIVEIRKKLQM